MIRQKILFFIWFIQCHLAITMYVQLAWTQLFHYNNLTWALRRLKSSTTQRFVVLTQKVKDPHWWSFMFGVNRRPMCSSHKDLTNTESVCTSWHHTVADNSSTWGLVQLRCGAFLLTHCGLVTPYGDRDLGQHWIRKWLTAPSHYLNQCWLIISVVQWH